MDIITKVASVDNNSNAPADLQEEWRDITDPRVIPGRYQVSNLGRVRNVEQNRILSLYTDSRGYVSTHLICQKGTHGIKFWVHRLVADAFLPAPREDQKQVDHIDCNPSNNRADNLAWCSREENFRNPGTQIRMAAASKKRSKAMERPVQCIETGEVFESTVKCAQHFGLRRHSVVESCKRYANGCRPRDTTHGGKPVHHFKYLPIKDEYVKRGEDKQFSPIAHNHPHSKAVRCVENSKIYDSAHIAAADYGISYAAVIASCKRSAQGLRRISGEGLVTVYHFEWYNPEDSKEA